MTELNDILEGGIPREGEEFRLSDLFDITAKLPVKLEMNRKTLNYYYEINCNDLVDNESITREELTKIIEMYFVSKFSPADFIYKRTDSLIRRLIRFLFTALL